MPPAQAPLGASGSGRPESKFGEGLSALPSLVLGTKFLRWMARRPRSCHDPADSGWSAGHGAVGKFRSDAAVAVASAMASEDGFNEVAHLRGGALGRGRHRGGSPVLQPPYSLPPPRWQKLLRASPRAADTARIQPPVC